MLLAAVETLHSVVFLYGKKVRQRTGGRSLTAFPFSRFLSKQSRLKVKVQFWFHGSS